MIVHPPCAWEPCGRPVRRRERETPSKWLKRQTCSQQCRDRLAGHLNGGRVEPGRPWHRGCLVCNNPVPKARGMTIDEWMAREYCSARCVEAARKDGAPRWPEYVGPLELPRDAFADEARTRVTGRAPSRPATHVETDRSLW